jgi:hypothetical protein
VKRVWEFTECSGLIPLAWNPGAGTGTFPVSLLLLNGLCDDGCCPSLSDSLGGSQLRIFESCVSLFWCAVWCRRRWDLWSCLSRRRVCEQSFVPSSHRVGCYWALWLLTSRFLKVDRYISVYARWYLSCFKAILAMAGQSLLQEHSATYIVLCPQS